MDCGTYKWMQSQTEVEVFVHVPENLKRQDVSLCLYGGGKTSRMQTAPLLLHVFDLPVPFLQVIVKLTPATLLVSLAGRVILSGKLFQAIKQEDSMWLLEDGVLHLTMLKRNRRGNYANNCTNADTFWQAVMQNSPRQETLQLAFPPAKYYHLPLASSDNTMQPQLTA